MSDNEFESSLLENAVNQLSRLPGIGRKTALRLALHLLRQEMSVGLSLGQSICVMESAIVPFAIIFLKQKYARYVPTRYATTQ